MRRKPKKVRGINKIRTSTRRVSIPNSGKCYSKKVDKIPIEGGKRQIWKTEIVREMAIECLLDVLIKAIKITRSTFYCYSKKARQTR